MEFRRIVRKGTSDPFRRTTQRWGNWWYVLLVLNVVLAGRITLAREEGRIGAGWSHTYERGGRVILKVEGDRASLGKIVKIEKVQATWYPEEDPEKRVMIMGERGSLDMETDDLQVEGKVQAFSPAWGKINANRIEWKAEEKKIIARGRVRARFKLPRKKTSAAD